MTDQKQVWSGAVFLLIGAAALWNVPRPFGTLASMGPGYFPMLLGVGLILVGVLAIALGARAGIRRSVERLPIVPACFVLSGVLGVSLLITGAGLAASLALLVATSCYARVLRRPLEVLAIYAVLLPLTWVIFVYAVQLPIGLF